MRKPHILHLASYLPLPAVHGAAKRMWSLHQRLFTHFDITLVAFDQPHLDLARQDEERRARYLEEFYRSVHVIPRASTESDHPCVRWMPATARHAYSPALVETVRRLLTKEAFDLFCIDLYEMAQYVELAPRLPALLTEHDVSNVSLSKSFLRVRAFGRLEERMADWKMALRYLRHFFPKFKRIITLTAPDQGRLARLLPGAAIDLVPTGVDLNHFTFAAPDLRRTTAKRLVYLGHYAHYPNEDAVLYFHKEVWPLVQRAEPGTQWDIVGSCPTSPVLGLAGPSVHVTGTVGDVRPLLREASVFIAPVRIGRGIKGKILEAFAAGTPVVTLSKVARALGAAPEEHLLVGDTPESFAHQVLRLFRDADLRRSLALRARSFAQAHYDWDTLAHRCRTICQEALSGRVEHVPR